MRGADVLPIDEVAVDWPDTNSFAPDTMALSEQAAQRVLDEIASAHRPLIVAPPSLCTPRSLLRVWATAHSDFTWPNATLTCVINCRSWRSSEMIMAGNIRNCRVGKGAQTVKVRQTP